MQTNDVMNQKLENYASSLVESIAGRRKRNVEWAKAAVRKSATLTAEQALATNVIDVIAGSVPALLRQIDGREVRGARLQTAGATVTEIPMILRERVFQLFWRPEVMFILMMIAIYGIIAEVSNPGMIIPGTVGVIALVLALYMSAVLPINIAGILLILVAVGLFIAEVFTPSFGVLTAAGLASFLVGGLMLFDRAVSGFRLPLGFVITTAVLTAGFFLFVVGAGLKAQRLPVRAGKETLIGRTSTANTPIDSAQGKIYVEGELWSAISEAPIAEGEPVEVVGSEGLTLKVKQKGK
jgi:membrane-bound serine protease (ClpP class)